MDANELKKIAKASTLVIGKDKVLKLLRTNQLESVYLALNAPRDLLEDVKKYALLNNVLCTELEVPNDDLGVICRKPFNVAVIGLRRADVTGKKKHAKAK
jgi:ribosomal protein L30E